MQSSPISIVHDIKTCGDLWNTFSPNESFFSLWEFRKAWLDGFKYKPYFIHYDNSPAATGLLPLWYNEEDKKYEWVGGVWPEDNTFFVSSSEVLAALLEAAPSPLELCAIKSFPDMTATLSHYGTLDEDTDLKYTLALKPQDTIESVLAGFAKKNRYRLRSSYNALMKRGATIKWIDTKDPSYFDRFVALKGKVFDGDEKEDNYYDDPQHIKTFRNVIQNAGKYSVRILQIEVDGTVVGIDIVIVYNDIFYLIGGAYDSATVDGVGNAALYLLLEEAIKQKSRLVDCLQEDSGWKHRYFTGTPLYVFEKK